MVYFRNSNTDVYFNLALDEYLLKNYHDDEIFLLWQNSNTIVVGKNQNTLNEININAVEEDKVNVIRRSSGGGAVYQDDGNLCFTFIVGKDNPLATNYQTILQPIVNVLQKLDLDVKFSGKNDLEIDGKKISGNAQIRYKDRLLHHGTILFDVDLNKMPKYLNVDQIKMQSKAIKSIPARVTNIKPLLKKPISFAEFKEFIEKELVKSNVKVMDLPPDIIKAAEELADKKYRTWEWNYGTSLPFNFENKLRFADKGTVEVKVDVENGVIKHIKFYGDFMGSKGTEELEQSLQNIKFKKEDVSAILANADLSEIFGPNFTKEEILEVLFV